MWNGVMTRVIDDLNSPFYEVKNSMITYFLALLEGLNNQIVAFLYSNFEI